MTQKSTPMQKQYQEIKKQYPGTLLFFRLGDFYELFNEDAVIGSKELEITLTARHKDSPNPIPMCGVPHHSTSNYIARLVKKGYRVAICEQTEKAGDGKKLVNREVVRVITPGTVIDSQLLEQKEPVYLASVFGTGESFGAAFLEISTGEFVTTQIHDSDSWQKIYSHIESFNPKEILYPTFLEPLIQNSFSNLIVNKTSEAKNILPFNHPKQNSRFSTVLTELDNYLFDFENCKNLLLKHFGIRDLSIFGLADKKEAICAAGACLQYAQQTQKASAQHISEINYNEIYDSLVLDKVTLENLEIIESRFSVQRNKRTLLAIIDETVTGMGARLLRSWLLRPSIKIGEIKMRQIAVSELTDSILRDKLRIRLKEVADLERLVGRLNLGTISPRDLLALNRTLNQTPDINNSLSDAQSLLLQVLSENIFELPEIRDLISASISEDAPASISDQGIIKKGFNNELDALREISISAKQIIAAFENEEKKRTGISNLKIKFNNVFGYFIEISKGNLNRVPSDYERRQTLTNAERYTTPQLKEWEQKVLGAEDTIRELELKIFQEIRQKVQAETKTLQSTARAIATLDALQSLAETSAKRNYVCPVLHENDDIEIVEGRHPVVEVFTNEEFIPNDLFMNNSTDRLLIITGANMSGKSTIMRQIALIQVLAQIGSFVPAKSARLPIIDRIWTRVGASDDLASGRSTFMVEMTETAAILHNSSPRSLILLDEIGRGTSTFDGLSIAWAVAEYLHNSPQHSAKTLFATHYHELTELAEILPGAKNFQISAIEKDGDIIFLHKLKKGKASKSYGIDVARLAGLPPNVIARAKQVLEKLEKYELAVFANDRNNQKGLEKAIGQAAGNKLATQVSLFAISNESLIDELREINLEEVSLENAKKILENLQKRII